MIFGRDLLTKEARDERLAHMVALVLAALTGKSTALFGKAKAPACAVAGASDGLSRRSCDAGTHHAAASRFQDGASLILPKYMGLGGYGS